jgi:hypothetical protein
MLERLAAIREKLDRLRASDPERRVHGAHPAQGHDYAEKPKLSERALASLESQHGVALPEDVRAFLRTVHGGGPGPGYGFALSGNAAKAAQPFAYTLDDVSALLELKKNNRWATLPDLSEEIAGDDDYPPGHGFLQLSHQGCGVFDVLIVTGPLRGSVWYYDNAWGPCSFDGSLPSFLDWYERWLDQNLRPSELARR